MDEALRVAEVCKKYRDRTVVDDLSLAVNRGECVALLGHNGAGKTTLIKLLLGLVQPCSGRIEVLGRPAGHVERRRAVGFLPENVAFPAAATGAEVLRFYARLQRLDQRVVDPMLQRLGLGDATNQATGTYSKGMRQRLGLAQALLGDPQLLLLDEPTSGLDPILRTGFYTILNDLKHAGVASLVCSHTLTEIEHQADRLAIMRRGRLVACGTLPELAAQTRLPVQLRVQTSNGQARSIASRLPPHAEVSRVNDSSFELKCLAPEKMPLLRDLSGFGNAIEDVDVSPPRLEHIYAHFTAAEGP